MTCTAPTSKESTAKNQRETYKVYCQRGNDTDRRWCHSNHVARYSFETQLCDNDGALAEAAKVAAEINQQGQDYWAYVTDRVGNPITTMVLS